ncbi:MAG: ParB/RepB/Spo0J family partition protein [Oscillospiraceae bacterium]|jgi:ParB family chromosome partitioning protein|nr:ParB/RepB/Spo0J family partition protein [Oscillospiraceae bacterium]
MNNPEQIKTGGQIILVPQSQIHPNPNQPRKRFNYIELESLAQSIKENGIIQPISVRQIDKVRYELIAGERRLRAARLAGISHIPCVLMNIDESRSALFGLTENLQRSDLDFFEEALAIEKLIKNFNMSQDEISKRLGKAQSTVSNKLRLLKFTESQRIRILGGGLTERHARALLSLKDERQVDKALGIIIDNSLNVQQTDKLVRQMSISAKPAKKPPIKLFKDIRLFINTLNNAVDTMRQAGIEADSTKNETEQYVEYIVRIPKARDRSVKSIEVTSA